MIIFNICKRGTSRKGADVRPDLMNQYLVPRGRHKTWNPCTNTTPELNKMTKKKCILLNVNSMTRCFVIIWPLTKVHFAECNGDPTATSLPSTGPQLQAPEVLPSQPGRAEDWEIKENEEILIFLDTDSWFYFFTDILCIDWIYNDDLIIWFDNLYTSFTFLSQNWCIATNKALEILQETGFVILGLASNCETGFWVS